MKPTDFWDKFTEAWWFFDKHVLQCEKKGYYLRDADGYGVIECVCGATWATELEPLISVTVGDWTVYATANPTQYGF